MNMIGLEIVGAPDQTEEKGQEEVRAYGTMMATGAEDVELLAVLKVSGGDQGDTLVVRMLFLRRSSLFFHSLPCEFVGTLCSGWTG